MGAEAGAAEVQAVARPAAAPAIPTFRKLRRELDGMVASSFVCSFVRSFVWRRPVLADLEVGAC